MTEPLILMAFVPFALLALFSVKRAYPLLTWSAVGIAAVCLGFFIFVKKDDPVMWVPVASFFTLVVLDVCYSRRLRVLPSLGCLFLAQALMSKDTGFTLIVIAFSDAFFCADIFSSSEVGEKSKAIQGIYQAALSLVPAALGVLLHLQGQAFLAAVACTIGFRLFSWPLNHWVYDVHKEARIFLIYAGSISAFALWHAQDFSTPGYWPLVWLAAATVFSIGAKYTEVYTALALAVFSASPLLGVLAVCFWPLFASQGWGVLFLALAAMGSGVVIVDPLSKILSVEGAYALVAISALAISRVFVGTPRFKYRWYYEAANLVSCLVLAGLYMYLTALPFAEPQNTAIVFAVVFVTAAAAGFFAIKRKPAVFAAKRNIPTSFFTRDLISFEFLEDKPGLPAKVKDWPPLRKVFRALETEAYVVILLGVLGVALLWRMK